MPRFDDIKSVLVIGSGPIVIGQAAEFDYSGTQACRVLKEEGLRVILVNSNPATIMTDPAFADATYIEPITTEFLTEIIKKERPDALLPTLGGQTALNAAVRLHDAGVLDMYGVRIIGASVDAIRKGEDRQAFKDLVLQAGAEVARSVIARSSSDALKAMEILGERLVVRPSFTMGGLGSSFVCGREEILSAVESGIASSPTREVLIEESIFGWKEYELELMRDCANNTVVVCSIENVDPVGVHTGDSITVAPAMTLTDVEYQKLRNISFNIVSNVGVSTGGCNIQFAVEPTTGRIVVIEMNPRVSRSSALASKATGFPIAKIAAKLAIGYRLDEIQNDITQKTLASFEPAIDYVVVKVPKFNFEKFPKADKTLTTAMKSVGEVMAIGRNFASALQKALRSLDSFACEFSWDSTNKPSLEEIATPSERRIVAVQQALFSGMSLGEVHKATKIDMWFLDQIQIINEIAMRLKSLPSVGKEDLKIAKMWGFSDSQIADLRGVGECEIRQMRAGLGVRPVFKMVDTCAGEFEAYTPYYYSCYEEENDARPIADKKVIVIGSGANRIGQGIEFDYSCVHAAFALCERGIRSIIINCNPETVSTDYNTASRLYFEPLTFEDVVEIAEFEAQEGELLGVIVQLGGQTALSLADRLESIGVPILGTSPAAINTAEDRSSFARILADLRILAPRNTSATDLQGALDAAEKIGYPVLVRPSFVLGGRAMEIVYTRGRLKQYFEHIQQSNIVSSSHPLLIDEFLEDATEIDVDALFDGKEIFIAGIMEHIEEAGVHSGDSACSLPSISLSDSILQKIREKTYQIAKKLGVVGLINIQFAHLASGGLYVLEANPRGSRTVPFVSKALHINLAQAATGVMLGESISDLRKAGALPASGDFTFVDSTCPIAVKSVVFPFARFPARGGMPADALLSPEMRSTGEVMGIDKDFPSAFAKSLIAIYGTFFNAPGVFISVNDRDKKLVGFCALRLAEAGYKIYTTSGTFRTLNRCGIDAVIVSKYSEAEGAKSGDVCDLDIVRLIGTGEIGIVINTPSGDVARYDAYKIRSAAVTANIPVVTTISSAQAVVMAICLHRGYSREVFSLQEYAKVCSRGVS